MCDKYIYKYTQYICNKVIIIQLCNEISFRASSNCTVGSPFLFLCLFCFDLLLSRNFRKCDENSTLPQGLSPSKCITHV